MLFSSRCQYRADICDYLREKPYLWASKVTDMKKIIAGCIGALMLGACTSMKQKETMENMYLMVGSYATPEEEGIKVYAWDNEKGEALYVSGLKGISNPSYQVVSADGNRVYSVGEDEGETSTAHSLSFDKTNGKLTLMNTQLTNGGAPCYINLSPDEDWVITANYEPFPRTRVTKNTRIEIILKRIICPDTVRVKDQSLKFQACHNKLHSPNVYLSYRSSPRHHASPRLSVAGRQPSLISLKSSVSSSGDMKGSPSVSIPLK